MRNRAGQAETCHLEDSLLMRSRQRTAHRMPLKALVLVVAPRVLVVAPRVPARLRLGQLHLGERNRMLKYNLKKKDTMLAAEVD